MLEVSVILCTHSPRADHLSAALAALASQTFERAHWELLVVDNASETPISDRLDLNWHPNARCIREEALGLTHARLRGIRDSSAPLLIFVDDDNLLAPDYLDVAVEISKRWPMLGAWGGRIVPKFEVAPPEWITPYLPMLAIREFDGDRWSNRPNHDDSIPCGAGMCMRRNVAIRYVQRVSGDPVLASLDRKGDSLASFGDTDMAITSFDLNLGTGMFSSLKLTHLLPGYRLQPDYIVRLAEGLSFSSLILRARRNGLAASLLRGSGLDSLRRMWRAALLVATSSKMEQRIHFARARGTRRAVREIASWHNRS
jgi:hypothetical protein